MVWHLLFELVQKEKRRRGRPRKYDPDIALQAALEAFWRRGFAETSLDHLSEATGMNRPSLYAAFGDKKSIYLQAVERFRRWMAERQMKALTEADEPLAGLRGFFRVALGSYTAGGGRGCMVISTTVVGAVEDDEIRAELKGTLERIDKGIRRWLSGLQEQGLIRDDADVRHLAFQVRSTMVSLGVHARAGYGRRRLMQLSDQSAEAILAPVLVPS